MRLLPILLTSVAILGCGPPRLPQVIQHEPWYTNGDPTKRPFASRDESTITLHPSEASFKIPQSWVERYNQYANNFHLTLVELDAVARGDGEWDTEYASVCNAVLPFDRCCAHVGGEGWAGQGGSFGDLQVRVYELDDAPKDVERRICGEGIADIKRFSGKAPMLKQDIKAPWRRTLLGFERFYWDYGGLARVDFRVRQFEKRTFVFVFMYTGDYMGDESQENAIASILDSFVAGTEKGRSPFLAN